MDMYAEAIPTIHNRTCAVCEDRNADTPVIVVTDEELEGAPQVGSRAIIVGMCNDCESSSQAKIKMRELMSVGSASPTTKENLL